MIHRETHTERLIPGEFVLVSLPLFSGSDGGRMTGEIRDIDGDVRCKKTTAVVLYSGPTLSTLGTYHVMLFGQFGIGWGWSSWCTRVR